MSAAPSGSTAPLRVAVVGCGDVSSVHFDAIAALPGSELVAVCDTDEERRTAAAERWGVPGYADHAELVAAARPDVAHVCTPHSTHAPIAIDLLDAGIDILLEKPVAHSEEAARELGAAAERSSATLGVCFQNRYNAPVAAAKRLIDSGELGAIRGASATVFWHRDADYYRSRPWRGRWETGGGGLLMNQAIHTIDLLQWLLGDVESVSGGVATRVLGDVIEVEDTADLVLGHRGGARSTFFATLSHVVDAPVTIDIVAEEGSLSLRGDLTVRRADGGVEVVSEREGTAAGRSYWGVSHELLIADFHARVRAGEPFWIDVAEASKSLAIIQSVYARGGF